MKSILNIRVTSSCNYTCGMCPFHGDGYSADYFQERPEWKREMKRNVTRGSRNYSY